MSVKVVLDLGLLWRQVARKYRRYPRASKELVLYRLSRLSVCFGRRLGGCLGYDEFFRSICSGGRTFGFDEKQNADPETCYFSGYTYRIMRALEWLKTLPEWDGKNLTVRGGS
ncbi:MAG: hypothetical protein IKG18_12235, partial [Atopobiaceae bacterium]|nr:hypothetical protein [Atopobiaceae bacterium]